VLGEAEEILAFERIEIGEMTPKGRVAVLIERCAFALGNKWCLDLTGSGAPAPPREMIRDTNPGHARLDLKLTLRDSESGGGRVDLH
jgi:hypothetical protein